MVVTYFTTDTAQWGAGKEAPLTPAERDDNFWTLFLQLAGVEQDFGEATVIQSIDVDGATFTVTLSDELVTDTETETETVLGPFPLPWEAFKWRGAWSAATAYSALDVFYVLGDGVYLVAETHTSAATFDAARNTGNPDYAVIYIKLMDLPRYGMGVVDITIADYTLTEEDAWQVLLFVTTTGAPSTITVPLLGTGYEVGAVTAFRQTGPNAIEILAGTGVTLNFPANRTEQSGWDGAVVYLRLVGEDEWDVYGDLGEIAT
jgi:hypothetical protein